MSDEHWGKLMLGLAVAGVLLFITLTVVRGRGEAEAHADESAETEVAIATEPERIDLSLSTPDGSEEPQAAPVAPEAEEPEAAPVAARPTPPPAPVGPTLRYAVLDAGEPIRVAGLAVQTDDYSADGDLARLWARFSEVDLYSQLRGVVGDHVYAVYDRYDQPTRGSFRVTLGYAVREQSRVPDGLTAATVLPGRYAVMKADPPDERGVATLWDLVGRSALPVARTTDLEIYAFDRFGLRIVAAELRVALTTDGDPR